MKYWILLASLALLPLTSPVAADERWYQVEVLVFARNQNPGGEHWRLDVRPDYPRDQAITYRDSGASLPDNADAPHRNALRNGAWQALSEGNLSLSAMRRQMEASGEYRSLFHSAWRQPMRERNQSLPIMIQGGRELPPDPSLYRASDALAADGDAEQAALPAFDGRPQYELQGTLLLSVSRFLHVDPNLWLARDDRSGQRYYVDMRQSRRMRSGELHYIDHPLFGMVIKVTR
ncbi:peptidoglycan binding protein CsiV [Isoalcanivorax indicus]|uniref:peptidoglycan binding protein CsiV n=1 Tax=Isoalcanivorax indicus TaxID=2202653 RepID=UPI0013C46C89|nr:peptidoglycan binding protein CsiV [Isoalcanivorax indicus]